jgi:3-methyladenine DNA glycosylase AlkD
MADNLGRLASLRAAARAAADSARAESNRRFFKTGPGQYGEGDVFLGLSLPAVRRLTREYRDLAIDDLTALLHSPFHEERLLALIILVQQYKKGDAATRERIYRLYLDNTAWINNWDLVDVSAGYIVGPQLDGGPLDVLDRLAASGSVWERRIAMIATFHYTMKGDPAPALRIAESLLNDRHDLIQKATGWMLREAGKRCGRHHLTAFLDQHAATMPRTTLRYAIEHLPPEERAYYLGLRKARGW